MVCSRFPLQYLLKTGQGSLRTAIIGLPDELLVEIYDWCRLNDGST
jgi:hypothetical protein